MVEQDVENLSTTFVENRCFYHQNVQNVQKLSTECVENSNVDWRLLAFVDIVENLSTAFVEKRAALSGQEEAQCEKGLSTINVDNPVEKCVEPAFPYVISASSGVLTCSLERS